MLGSPEITTKRFRLASVTPPTVSDEWLRWAADEKLMRPINAPVRMLSRADLRRYVADSQRLGRSILGIYERRGGAHIGLYETELDDRHGLATIDVIIDQERFDLSNVLKETDPALLRYLAERFGTHKAVVKIVVTYAAALRHFEATGWRKEGVLRGERPSADGGGRIDVIQFGKLLVSNDTA